MGTERSEACNGRHEDIVARTLRAHGASAAAVAAATGGEALRRRTERQGIECALLLDIEAGQTVGGVAEGDAGGVDVSAQLQRLRPDKSYLALHTHCRSSSFSPDDVLVLVVNPTIQAIAVVAVDGTWYVLSKPPGAPPPGPLAVVHGFRTAATALSSHFLAQVRSGAASREEALRAFSDTIWQQVAPQLGLRYDRVDPA